MTGQRKDDVPIQKATHLSAKAPINHQQLQTRSFTEAVTSAQDEEYLSRSAAESTPSSFHFLNLAITSKAPTPTNSSIQRHSSIPVGSDDDFERNLSQACSNSSSLEPKIQTQMESAMGAEFSHVKIHTDSQADHLSRSVQAKSFTTGNDVFFKQGAYNPNSHGGQELLAHELTHVVQQSGSTKVQKRNADISLEAPNISTLESADAPLQRITDDEADDFIDSRVKKLVPVRNEKRISRGSRNKRRRWEMTLKTGLLSFAEVEFGQSQENDDAYTQYLASIPDTDALEKICTKIEMGNKNLTEPEMAQDIQVPQGYYHVTKGFGEIGGLMTDGAGPCTGLAMSAQNEDGEVVYALTHIDEPTDFKTVINNMIRDMNQQLGTIDGLVRAYVASGSGVRTNGKFGQTTAKVIPYLNSLETVDIQLVSRGTDIRIGGETQEDDQVRTGQYIEKFQSDKKDIGGLIAQVEAMPKMKRGHEEWNLLPDDDNKSDQALSKDMNDNTEPMEKAIYNTLRRAKAIEHEVEDNSDIQDKLDELKSVIKNLSSWYSLFTMGKRLLFWANN